MEHDPIQPIEKRHHRLTPDQEAHASREIEQALERINEFEPTISRQTARVIAAAIHTGEGSMLEHFASTDRLDAKQALMEVNEAIRRRDHPTWGVALAFYLERFDRPLPDTRPPDYNESPPEVFLRSPTSGRAEWIPLISSARALEMSLQNFDPDWATERELLGQLDRDDWEIGNVVGFYGVDVSGAESLRKLFRLAQGVNQYGESFAAYLELFGLENASRYTYKRLHMADFENMAEFVASFAYAHGLLDVDNRPGDDRTRGPTVSTELIVRSLRRSFVWRPGREKLHVFSKDTLGHDQETGTDNE